MIHIAKTCGLCEGAARALRITREQVADAGTPIVLYNDLLHNAAVMEDLRGRGVRTVHAIEDVPKNAVLVVSAHGMGASNYQYLKENGIPCVDATCPKVISIHKIAKSGRDEGRTVVIIGKKNHPEVEGIRGWGGRDAVVVQSEEDLPALAAISSDKALVICQSTFNGQKAEALVEKIKEALSERDVLVKNTICPAQRSIQHASVKMAKNCDVVFVLGGYNSSNTVELFNLCSATGTECYHVDSLVAFYSLIQTLRLTGDMEVGLTAGASTTKEEIESCRALLAYYLFYKESREALARDLEAFNAGLTHKNPLVKGFVEAFASVNRGGKNLRGILVGLGYRLAGGEDPAHSRPLGLAAEIFQTAILIHDDIIDHAFLRRGLPTVPHQLRQRYRQLLGAGYETEAADIADSVGICAGDVGFYYANQIICKNYAKDVRLAPVLAYFSQMAVNTMYGEVLDVMLPFEEKSGIAKGPREDSVMETYHLKTAWYSVVGPLCLGMLLAGAEEKQVRAMEEMADHLGRAFQIKDDLMGIFSQEENLGKPMSDIAEYKQTLLYAYVHDKAPAYMEELKSHYGKNPLTVKDVAAVQEIFVKSGARAYAEKTMKEMFKQADAGMHSINFVKDADKDLLLGFVQYLQLRTK